MDMKMNNVVRVPTSINGKFFRFWLEFLEPFHSLTKRELDVATSFLKHRYELAKVIKDPDILDKVTMGEETRRKIRTECKMTLPHFQVVMSKLREGKFVIYNKINPRFIPNIEVGEGYFSLLILFELK